MEKLNLKFKTLKKSRKDPVVGDVFVWTFDGKEYGFGRVMKMTPYFDFAKATTHLIYLYDAFSIDKNNIPELSKDKLLTNYMIVDKVTWIMGFFETVGNIEVDKNDILGKHCFWKHASIYPDNDERLYIDERGKRIRESRALKNDICVIGAITLANGISRRIEEALKENNN